MAQFKDLTGQKFGRLLVVEKGPEYMSGNRKRFKWKCICDCGNEYFVRGDALISGATKSCGCLNQEKRSKRGKDKVINLIGQIFDLLTVVDRAGSDRRGEALWLCQCSCGSDPIIVLGSNLRSGHTTSCGCRKSSKGVEIIEKILKELNYIYEKEKTFETCIFSDTNRKAQFDFFVNNKYLIEYDGEQHFQSTAFNISEEEFLRNQWKDKIKNQYCLEQGIPLIRIPYTHLKNIKKDDIILETSKFIIKGENND